MLSIFLIWLTPFITAFSTNEADTMDALLFSSVRHLLYIDAGPPVTGIMQEREPGSSDVTPRGPVVSSSSFLTIFWLSYSFEAVRQLIFIEQFSFFSSNHVSNSFFSDLSDRQDSHSSYA